MNEHRCVAICHFGMEAVLKRELKDLGFEIKDVTDGRVAFLTDNDGIARSNIHLRTAKRILLAVSDFDCRTFDELFAGVENTPWEDYITEHGRFWVTKASSTDSRLTSLPDIQSVAKKAMVERLKKRFGIDIFPEDGEDYPVRIFLRKDHATVYLDTTGSPLHKRGYRTLVSDAPIEETLAAAIIGLTPWRGERILVDPFCGSGTFLIEAAMRAANIAPGAYRHFNAEKWPLLGGKPVWDRQRELAKSDEDRTVDTHLYGYDIDPEMVRIAISNAERAGVGDLIRFKEQPVSKLQLAGKYGFIVTNPPYGERIGDRSELPALYGELGRKYLSEPTWSMYVISGYDRAEECIGRKADKNRKLYNGMIMTRLYQYLGEKPPK